MACNRVGRRVPGSLFAATRRPLAARRLPARYGIVILSAPMPSSLDARSSPARACPFHTGWTLLIGSSCAFVIALTLTSQTYYVTMADHGHSFAPLLAWQLSAWMPWALAAPSVMGVGAGFGDGRRATVTAMLGVVSLGIMLISVRLLVTTQVMAWLQPYAPVETYTFGKAFSIHVFGIPADALVYALLILAGYAAAVRQRGRDMKTHEAQLEADLARAQLDALRVEIAPHFLFNALHSIAALIRSHANDRAISMLLGLSDLLRTAVDGAGAQTTTVAADVALVRRYVELQQLRFGDRLDVDYSVAADCQECAVPTLLLQPLVENAFRHGIARQTGRCRLQIGAERADDILHLWVRDDGAGLPPGFELTTASGTGLRSLRLRLQRLYGRDADVELSRVGGRGTVARVRLPARVASGPPARQAAG